MPPTVTCCRPTCNEPAEIAVLDHRPAPDRSLCPACRAENRRLLAAIPAALRAKAAAMTTAGALAPAELITHEVAA